MELLFLLLLIVITITAIIIIRNLMKRVEILEDIHEEDVSTNEMLLDSIEKIKNRIDSCVLQMRQIDRLGSFESDDETGIVFKQLLKLVEDIDSDFYITEEEETDSGK